jgi:uncharacterized surface protein with fasciclin (FAS1) repeats
MILLVLIMVLTGCSDSESRPIACAGRGDQPGATSGGEAGVTEAEAAGMSIAELLMTDPRFDEFRNLTAQTVSGGLGISWLEIWDMDAERMGDNRDGVTVFVPADTAFARLDPGLASALREGGLDNELRYTLLGHHYVHRLYPSSEWESGPQRTWRGGGTVEMTLDPPTWGGCPIGQTDIRVNNGYIHVLDGIVIPDEIQQAVAG